MADVRQAPGESFARGFRVLRGNRQRVANHRRNQRRALSAVRQGREIVVLRREHRRGSLRGLAGFVQLPASGPEKRLRGGAQEGRSLTRGATERRRKSG